MRNRWAKMKVGGILGQYLTRMEAVKNRKVGGVGLDVYEEEG